MSNRITSPADVCIEMRGVSKYYTKPDGGRIVVVDDVSLTVRQGDTIGLLGKNGSGKTTLLKLISGITEPSAGSIVVRGSVASLMNLEAGFHMELTGRENIMVNALLVGLSRGEVMQRTDEIIKFSEIEGYIDMPLYSYSDGMKFRLAFAIAVASNCDILVIDEIFVSGDTDFQLKTLKTIRDQQIKRNLTIIMSSHVLTYVSVMTKRYLCMSHGGKLSELTRGELRSMLSDQNRDWQKNLGITFNVVTN